MITLLAVHAYKITQWNLEEINNFSNENHCSVLIGLIWGVHTPAAVWVISDSRHLLRNGHLLRGYSMHTVAELTNQSRTTVAIDFKTATCATMCRRPLIFFVYLFRSATETRTRPT